VAARFPLLYLLFYRQVMRILAFSDIHRDLEQAARLVEMSAEADLVIGAGDFGSVHEGLEEIIEALSGIKCPTILVAGNNERLGDLREVAGRLWPGATVLHGDGVEIDGVSFFGLGGGIPVTPWSWSFDLEESEASELLEGLPEGAVLVVHSPPKGHCDVTAEGVHLGSTAILDAIRTKSPELVVCGHIHEAWGMESGEGTSKVVNLGPEGRYFEIGSGSEA
jgi:Icc-related predicted phosphoesterase